MSEQVGQRRPTIRQVASHAGVSHQTVSRFLRADPGMRPEVRDRIERAVAALGYRPNLAARAMRARSSGRLALVLPLGTAAGSLGILSGAREAAAAEGYELDVLLLDHGATSREQRIVEFADVGFFDGLVSLVPLPAPLREGATGTAVLVTEDYDDEMRSIGRLARADAVQEIVATLARAGHRRFLHLAGGYGHTSARNRRDAYLAAIGSLGLESSGVVDCEWEDEPARRAIAELPADSGVTAVVTSNDKLAAGAIRGAIERGWRVPEDLVVTGWDDHEVSRLMIPSLTSVRTHYEVIGRHAVACLLAVMRGEQAPAEPDGLTEVIWRESTGDLSRVLG